MGRKILFLNLLLLAVLLLLAQQFVAQWSSFEETQGLAEVIRNAETGPLDDPVLDLPEPGQANPLPDFLVIAQRNLFSPSRTPVEPQEEVAVVPTPPALPKRPNMNGSSDINGEIKAFITVFEGNRPQGETRIVGIGDTVQGYVVTDITNTTLTLKWNDHTELIDMLNAEAPQQAASASRSTPALTLITVGSRLQAVDSTSPEKGTAKDDSRGGTPGAVSPASPAGVASGSPTRRGVGSPAGRPAVSPAANSPSGRPIPATLGLGSRPGPAENPPPPPDN